MGMSKNYAQSMHKAFVSLFIITLVSCGVTTPESEMKVVGGKFVKSGSMFAKVIAKHTVALLDSKLRAFCTGSLINDEFILTAAHCVDGEGKTSLKYIGFHVDFHKMSTKTRVDVIKNKLRRVAGIYQHDGFEMDPQIFGPKYILTQNAVDDIALIRFKGGFPDSYKPVELLSLIHI